MHFAFVAYDRPNGVKRRMDARPDHLRHLESLGDRLVLAGPFLDDDGNMIGSFMVIEADSQEEAQATFDTDPYVAGGIFDSIAVKPFRITINKTRAG